MGTENAQSPNAVARCGISRTEVEGIRRLLFQTKRKRHRRTEKPIGLHVHIFVVDYEPKGGVTMSIGERIRRARVMTGQSQRDLAEKAGVSVSAISSYEQDLNIPDLTVLVQLAQALGLK